MSETTSTEDTTSSSRDESSDEPTPKPLPKKEYPKGYDLQQAVINAATTKRVMADVPEPRANIPTDDEFWESKDVPNISFIQGHLRYEGKFDPEHLIRLFELVYDLYSSEANIVYVNSPATICGDIHGQFYDLLKLFEVGGDPSGRNYIFLGDYVDRGDFSIECLILLFSYKIVRPDAFYMIRGNHECRHLTDHFTFKEECLKKYNLEVYDTLMDVFDSMPLAAIMNDQFFCVHGGISPDISTLDDIMQIERFMEPPSNGPFCDLLWSDPHESFDKEKEIKYVSNQARGVSYNFGYTAVKDFLVKNNLLAVIRGHECQKNGFRMYKKRKSSQFPILITLFSAPNYAAHYNNKGAVMCYEDGAMTIKQFTDSPFPYSLPSYQNVLAWSIPFVAGKINELMMGFLNLINDAEADEEEKEKIEMQRKLKQKILAVGRLATVFASMKDEREKSLLINGFTTSSGEVPQILQGKTNEEIKEVLSLEEGVRQVDAANEAMPAKADKPVEAVVETKSRLQNNPEIFAARRSNSMNLNMSSSPTASTSDFLTRKSTIPKITLLQTT